MANIFIDTNIVIDFIDNTRERHLLAKQVLKKAVIEYETMIISEDMLTTIYYICKKNIDHQKLMHIFEIFQKRFMISAFGQDTIHTALLLCKQNPTYDFEDTLQTLCAKKNRCKIIVSNDKSFPIIEGITVENAETFTVKK